MKRFLLLLACWGAAAGAADLASARKVYILSMSRGFDQYLANRLTNQHLLQVVTDPKLADVVLTDRLGEAFQAQMDTMLTTPEMVAAEAKAKEEKKKETESGGVNAMFTAPVNKLPTMTSNFGHNKGTIFLVNTKSREVVWSVYEPPRGTTGRELDRTASDVVNRLKKDLTGK
jgi:hypothetical protein